MRFFHRIPAFIMVYHKLFFDRFQYLYQIPANFTYQICPNLLSLPVRERGLKLMEDIEIKDEIVSLPVRERGLKFQHFSDPDYTGLCRSPCGSVD